MSPPPHYVIRGFLFPSWRFQWALLAESSSSCEASHICKFRGFKVTHIHDTQFCHWLWGKDKDSWMIERNFCRILLYFNQTLHQNPLSTGLFAPMASIEINLPLLYLPQFTFLNPPPIPIPPLCMCTYLTPHITFPLFYTLRRRCIFICIHCTLVSIVFHPYLCSVHYLLSTL